MPKVFNLKPSDLPKLSYHMKADQLLTKFESSEQISKVWQADAHFNPQMPKSKRQHHFNRWAKAVDRAGNWDKEDQS